MGFNSVQLKSEKLVSRLKDFWAEYFLHLKDHFLPHHRNNYQPYMLSGRLLSLIAILLLSIRVFSFASASLVSNEDLVPKQITSNNIIALTNQTRAEFGITSLKESLVLNKAAQAKAEDMLNKGYFAHNAPDGKTPWQFLENVGYDYFAAGENLAINFSDADSLEQAWMNSPSHKANILRNDFEEIGIGIAQGKYFGKPAVFVVQMFGVPSEQKIKLLNSYTVVEKNLIPKPAEETFKEKVDKNLIASAEVVPAMGDRVKLKVVTQNNAVKVLAGFGNKAVMLNPKLNNVWEAYVDISKLTTSNSTLNISVSNLENQKQQIHLATFAEGLISDKQVLGASTQESKLQINKTVETTEGGNVYLWFVLVLLSCLILAIAIHPKIQHVGMLANGSLVTMFAIMMWWLS